MFPFVIRRLISADFPAVKDIYVDAVADKFQTADLEMPDDLRWKQWWDLHSSDAYPVLVAANDKQVVGWISISPYRSGRMALAGTIELSYYVHRDHRRNGVASQLLQSAIVEAGRCNYRKAVCIVLGRNIPSKSFLKKAGFILWGVLPDVACIDDQYCDHEYWGMDLQLELK